MIKIDFVEKSHNELTARRQVTRVRHSDRSLFLKHSKPIG